MHYISTIFLILTFFPSNHLIVSRNSLRGAYRTFPLSGHIRCCARGGYGSRIFNGQELQWENKFGNGDIGHSSICVCVYCQARQYLNLKSLIYLTSPGLQLIYNPKVTNFTVRLFKSIKHTLLSMITNKCLIKFILFTWFFFQL